jgi:hypothetical protein
MKHTITIEASSEKLKTCRTFTVLKEKDNKAVETYLKELKEHWAAMHDSYFRYDRSYPRTKSIKIPILITNDDTLKITITKTNL